MQFPSSSRGRGIRCGLVVAALVSAATSDGVAIAAPPVPVITPNSTLGMAPCTIHVHAESSTLGAGSWTTARIQWNFGDPAGSYNELEGQNAAHMYTSPGQYVVTLKITNENGQSAEKTLSVVVQSDTRSILYVAENGDDDNPGTSPSAPLKTVDQALDLLQDDMTILFRRGDVFEVDGSGDIEHSNVVFAAYGTGGKPILRYVGPAGYSAIFHVPSSSTHDVTVQTLRFDSIHNPATTHDTVDAFRIGGRNITIWNCKFDDVSMVVNNNLVPEGVLVGNCTAEAIATYFGWVEGTDHVYVGNVVGISYFEHIIRLANTDRVLIASNSLTNLEKCTIWAMLGEDCAIVGNSLFDGRICLGPNPAQPGPGDVFERLTFERNYVEKSGGINAAIDILAGSEHMMFRNNIIQSDARPCFDVSGYDEETDRTSSDIDIFNNTGLNDSDESRFITVEDGAIDVRLRNNLYVAPKLVSGIAGTSNVYVGASNLASFTAVSHNVWTIPAEFAWVPEGYHYVWPYWSDDEGYKSPAEWNAYSVVSDEAYEIVNLTAIFAPPAESIAATHGIWLAGVHTDFYGDDRPPTGPWSAGAVSSDSSGGAGVVEDLDDDGDVDFSDLFLLLSEWGECPGAGADCDGDLDSDGAVGFADLLGVLSAWG